MYIHRIFGGKLVRFLIRINIFLLYKLTLDYILVQVIVFTFYQWTLKLGLQIKTFSKSVFSGLLKNVLTFHSRLLEDRVMVVQTFCQLFLLMLYKKIIHQIKHYFFHKQGFSSPLPYIFYLALVINICKWCLKKIICT